MNRDQRCKYRIDRFGINSFLSIDSFHFHITCTKNPGTSYMQIICYHNKCKSLITFYYSFSVHFSLVFICSFAFSILLHWLKYNNRWPNTHNLHLNSVTTTIFKQSTFNCIVSAAQLLHCFQQHFSLLFFPSPTLCILFNVRSSHAFAASNTMFECFFLYYRICKYILYAEIV